LFGIACFKKNYSLEVTFFFFQNFAIFFVVYIFPQIFTICFSFFSQQELPSLKILKLKNTCWFGGVGGGGLIQIFNAKISPNNVTFIYTKQTKIKK
jgi:hypothetical protein